MSSFIPAQHTVNTRCMTCAFWGRGMPCRNGNLCKYAHRWVFNGRLADLPRRDRRTGLCLAGRNRWEFEEAQRQAAEAEQQRSEREQRQLQHNLWLREEEERQRDEQQLRRIFAEHLKQRQQQQQSASPVHAITPLSPSDLEDSISDLSLGAPLDNSSSPRSSISAIPDVHSNSSDDATKWEAARSHWNTESTSPSTAPSIAPHNPNDHITWLRTFMPTPQEREVLFGARQEWDAKIRSMKENAHREAVYKRTGMYPFPAPPARTQE